MLRAVSHPQELVVRLRPHNGQQDPVLSNTAKLESGATVAIVSNGRYRTLESCRGWAETASDPDWPQVLNEACVRGTYHSPTGRTPRGGLDPDLNPDMNNEDSLTVGLDQPDQQPAPGAIQVAAHHPVNCSVFEELNNPHTLYA